MTKNNSFDLIRIIAAYLVMLSHSFALVGLNEPEPVSGYTFGRIGVNVFFALSGYLVFQSLDRDPNLIRFLAKRIIRIFPGLAVMLIITICIIGPMFTSLSLNEYFFRSDTWRYFEKIKLWGDDRLPGVFEKNPYPSTVNGSLWTLKWEWLMYCILSGMVFIGHVWRITAIIFLSILFGTLTLFSDSNFYSGTFPFLENLLAYKNPFLPGSFFCIGALLAVRKIHFFVQRYSIIYLAMFSCALFFLAVGGSVNLQIGFWLLIPFLIFKIGESDLSARIGLDIRNDLSYGLYIYAFPIQQSIVALWPNINWWGLLLLSTPITAGVAYISWLQIEKPALMLKTRINQLSFKATVRR